MKCNLLTLLIGCFILTSCRKDMTMEIIPETPKTFTIPSGNYSGLFTVYYPYDTFSNPTSVIFDSSHFFNEKSSDTYPLGGQGQVTVTDDTLIFEQFNYWQTIYDWQLYLSGEYHYILDSTHIFFSKMHSGNVYFYDLELD
ncbi:MAG: hypothetical protein JNJ99_03410 [Crocinitomicaceae bacterium]|nr:hypothetical protein [Crocinitomicaceae bacterium]